jgi:plasmid maintenance system antidote protein VapI
VITTVSFFQSLIAISRRGRPERRNIYELGQYDLFLKPGAVDLIKQVKGWRNDSEVAEGLGYAREYVNKLKNQKKPVTVDVISRIAAATGNLSGSWHVFYDFKKVAAEINPDSPSFNRKKYFGEVPYRPFSPSAELRRLDNPNIETRKY